MVTASQHSSTNHSCDPPVPGIWHARYRHTSVIVDTPTPRRPCHRYAHPVDSVFATHPPPPCPLSSPFPNLCRPERTPRPPPPPPPPPGTCPQQCYSSGEIVTEGPESDSCSFHSDCPSATYCDLNRECFDCDYCVNIFNDAIDGSCPDTCATFTTATPTTADPDNELGNDDVDGSGDGESGDGELDQDGNSGDVDGDAGELDQDDNSGSGDDGELDLDDTSGSGDVIDVGDPDPDEGYTGMPPPPFAGSCSFPASLSDHGLCL